MLTALIAGYVGFQYQQYRTNTGPERLSVPEIKYKPENNVTGQIRPDFVLQDKDGKERYVQEWDGKVLVINFWATWCPPCREEIPGFIRLQNKYADRGLQFVGIALQTAAEVQDFIAELGINYPVLVGLDDVIKVAEDYGNKSGVLPYTVIIDREQKIRFIRRGPLHYEEAETAILTVL